MAKTTARAFSWVDFEETLFRELWQGLRALGEEHQTFYAGALFGVYRELDGALCLPLLAANTVEHRGADDGEGFWSERWNPPDWWYDDVAPRTAPLAALEEALTAEATRGSQTHWSRTEARYLRVLLRVARRLRDAAPEVLPVTADFIFFFHDEEAGAELARRTVPKARFELLFPDVGAVASQRAALEELDGEAQAAALVERFGCYTGVTSEDAERGLLELGAVAAGPLVATLGDDEGGWKAAGVLARLRVASPEVVNGLRRHASSGEFPQAWYALALGALGDTGWLLAHPDPAVAAVGLTAPLLDITWKGATPTPLDYAPLEELLSERASVATPLVERALRPGSPYVKIDRDDVSEALRGLDSQFAAIRWHAAALLGARRLGVKLGRQVLPRLAAALDDPHEIVRRLAALSIKRWKKLGEPYLPDR